MHPLYDTSKLADDEIVDKLAKAHQYMSAQMTLGHTQTVDSIRNVIESLEEERGRRLERAINEEQKKKPQKSTITLGEINGGTTGV